jgi:hypothetical protein
LAAAQAWLATVGFVPDCAAVPAVVVQHALGVLARAGVVPAREYDARDFVDARVAALV